jgi:hypothetical protein
MLRAREYVMLAKSSANAATVLCLCAGTAVTQSVDPQELLNRVIRRQEIEMQQRFEDRQEERQRRQQEEAYDGKRCVARTEQTGDMNSITNTHLLAS